MNTSEPRYNVDHDEPHEPEVLQRCDATLSPDCTDDGQYEVWDGHTLIRLCLQCRRVFERRQSDGPDPLRTPGVEGGCSFDYLRR